VKIARSSLGVLAAWLVLLPLAALGQSRVQFPSMLPLNTASQPAGAASSSVAAGSVSTYAPGATPGYPPATTPLYPPGTVPSYPPGSVAPSYGPGLPPGPSATFQGGIQPPTTWDPYGTPGVQPAPLFPQDPYLAGPGYPTGTVATMRRFLQEMRLDYVWMPGSGPEELGIHDADLSATFAVPFFYNQQTPLLVTPGFAFQLWNGPVAPDFPPRTFEAYLDTAWNPQVTPTFGGELAFRIGVYSDFSRVSNESIRYTGHGLAVISLSPSFQVKAGVMYLDRVHVKLLPAGGVVWTPNPDVRFEILFPNPKLATRLTTVGNTDWWLYCRGEYGGGSWTVKRNPGDDQDEVDYNDMRFAVGLEYERLGCVNGRFEVGIAFERELFYRSPTTAAFEPNPTVFVGGAFAY